jgi:hypothetical protein
MIPVLLLPFVVTGRSPGLLTFHTGMSESINEI